MAAKKSKKDELLTQPEEGAAIELSGTLERVLFHNEANGYSVLRLKVSGKADPVSAVGTMHQPQVGVALRLEGDWTEHARFGRQFQFRHYDIVMPATTEGIRHYLGSGLIKGVRQRMAERIVERFGEDTFRVLDEEPERLAEVKGLSVKVIDSVKTAWAEHQSIRSLIMFLQPHGISTSYAVRIYKHYGADALEVVRENPYRLAMDIRGIGFVSADAAAMKLGLEKDSPLRAEAGVLYTLKNLSDDGHVFYPLDELVRKSSEDLDIDEDLAAQAVQRLEKQERVVVDDLYADGELRCQGVYLAWNHTCEAGISHYLHKLINSPKSVDFADKRAALTEGLAKTALELGEEQLEAVRAALDSKALVITGGPGTGKTTVINTIIKVFEGRKAKILLAAPTGRAAKRMAETSGREAKTIHRLLEYSPSEDGFARNENNPLACGLLVVDEASMLDNVLMFHLVKALPLGATLIFVGDVNQLPSVGAGNVLRDIMASRTIPVVELTEIFRQAAESAIILNAHRINAGEMPMPREDDGKLSDFYFIRQEDPEKCADLVVELVCNHIPRRFKLNPLDDIQVLTPMHKGSAGSQVLNAKLQAALNRNAAQSGSGAFIGRGDRQFRLDDKVMQIRNNYEKDVFNGDIGRICYLDPVDKELTVRFEDRNVLYSVEELDELVPAYAISVHKSQGSEYPAVVMPILTQHYVLLQRNLLYTGVTRGKQLVIVVGSTRAVAMAVHNNKTQQRYTWLAHRLAGSA
ncbi:MAG: ATP-dependent RecD-like DNA helicase [Deltaproteobacteria bacterium]|jgi:exodeoxyribonuclease V alpha subunit|nr:ATP-dependent RecD-like DNA helicase [Deltaproteobacteria bacterium]